MRGFRVEKSLLILLRAKNSEMLIAFSHTCTVSWEVNNDPYEYLCFTNASMGYSTAIIFTSAGCRDAENEGLAEYDGEEFYVENLRRTARQSMQPHLIAHSPAPLRALPYHAPYGSLHKASVLSTFNGQSIPTYRAEALVDELKGHLV